MTTQDKIRFLIEKAKISSETLAIEANVNRTTVYHWKKYGTENKEHLEVIERFFLASRFTARPKFTALENEVEYRKWPPEYLLKDMKFTPQELSDLTGYSARTVINWWYGSTKTPIFTLEKLRSIYPKLKAIREEEIKNGPRDLLKEWCEETGTPFDTDLPF